MILFISLILFIFLIHEFSIVNEKYNWNLRILNCIMLYCVVLCCIVLWLDAMSI